MLQDTSHRIIKSTRLLNTCLLSGLGVAVLSSMLVFLYLNGYESLIEQPAEASYTPPQIAGAAAAIPAPLESVVPAIPVDLPIESPVDIPIIKKPESPSIETPATTTAMTPFVYTFNEDGLLHEARVMEESSSPYFWLSAGGSFSIEKGLGKTQQGDQSDLSRWRLAYKRWNPLDTDSGYYPQNIFRLVTRATWTDARVEAQMRIEQDNLTASPNRNASNGLLLMSRYQDQYTLYYAGIRVDGTAVIKKKYKGTYYTMAQKPVFPGTYSNTERPNLLPHSEWLSLRSETTTAEDGSVTVSLYLKRANETDYTLLLSSRDDGKKYGNTPPITTIGHTGIRTDFMDVSFKYFRVDPL